MSPNTKCLVNVAVFGVFMFSLCYGYRKLCQSIVDNVEPAKEPVPTAQS